MNDKTLYVILTPPPHPKSAGITYLNNLSGYLRSIGKRVLPVFHIEPQGELLIWNSQEIPNQIHWQQPWNGHWVKYAPGYFAKIFGDLQCIFIHGENKHCKWFEGLNVVRYYLAGIGDLQKKGVPTDQEFKLTWDLFYCENADFVLRKSTFRGDLNAASTLDIKERNLDLTYAGKAWLHTKEYPRLPNTLELTRNWPDSVDEYFYLLSKTRFVFSYDFMTSVIEDAIILGAFPIFINTELRNRKSWYDSISNEMHGCFGFYEPNFHKGLENFYINRRKFITKVLERENVFLDELGKFCERAEEYFNFSKTADA